MGIDFNNLGKVFENIANASAKITNDDKKDVINNAQELFTYKTSVDAVKNQAEISGEATVEEVEAAAKKELSKVMDYSFGETAGLEDKNQDGVFSEDEISLESLMSYLDDNIDMEKVKEYNDKGIVAQDSELKAVDTLTDAGFDSDLVELLVNDSAISGAVRYIVKDILSGTADRMFTALNQDDEYTQNDDKNAEIIGFARFIGEDERNKEYSMT